MSTQPTEATVTEPQETTGTTTEQPSEQPKPTETVEFWREKAREQEKRAKSNADAAKRLAEIEDAQKTEAQKSAEALTKETQRADAAERRSLALEIAVEHKLGTDDVGILSALPDEDSMRTLATRLAGQQAEPKGGAPVIPNLGKTATAPNSEDAEARRFAKNLFSSSS